jgi:mRNA-degrading endonuclease RelE of RelBE toxin-antitoxin system
MKVEHAESFDKSVRKIKDVIALKRLKVLIEKLKEANTLKEISNVIPIENSPFLYRIRTGNYHLLVEYRDSEITILLISYLKRDDNTYRKYS